MAADDRVPLGRSSLRVSRLGIGAMTWGGGKLYGGSASADDEAEALAASLRGGINFFDTAEVYGGGGSERRLGALTRGADVVLATKFFPRPPRTAGSLPAALAGSLERLGRGSVGLYQIHWPAFWISNARLMDRLADAAQSGQVTAVGVSNYSARQMRAAHAALARRGVCLASNQVDYSLLHRRPEVDGVLDACRELGVTLIAYMPLAMGALTGKYSATTRPPDRLRRMLATFGARRIAAREPVLALLREIGARHGKTPAQVALRWLIEQASVIPIPGAKNGRQAADNAGALTFSLGADEVAALSDATLAWRDV